MLRLSSIFSIAPRGRLHAGYFASEIPKCGSNLWFSDNINDKYRCVS